MSLTTKKRKWPSINDESFPQLLLKLLTVRPDGVAVTPFERQSNGRGQPVGYLTPESSSLQGANNQSPPPNPEFQQGGSLQNLARPSAHRKKRPSRKQASVNPQPSTDASKLNPEISFNHNTCDIQTGLSLQGDGVLETSGSYVDFCKTSELLGSAVSCERQKSHENQTLDLLLGTLAIEVEENLNTPEDNTTDPFLTEIQNAMNEQNSINELLRSLPAQETTEPGSEAILRGEAEAGVDLGLSHLQKLDTPQCSRQETDGVAPALGHENHDLDTGPFDHDPIEHIFYLHDDTTIPSSELPKRLESMDEMELKCIQAVDATTKELETMRQSQADTEAEIRKILDGIDGVDIDKNFPPRND